MLDVPSGALWTPQNGWTNQREREAAKAIEEYDPGLILGFRQDTDEWVIFVRSGPHDGQPFPVFGLGRELPAPEELKKKLYTSDVRRHGGKIVKQIMDRQKAAIAEERKELDDATGVVAEHMDHAHRKLARGGSRIFIPAGVRSIESS